MLTTKLEKLYNIEYLQSFRLKPFFSINDNEMVSYSLETQGKTLKKASNILKLIPEDMTGLTFLDIGCNKGFFCFEALLRKAKSITGIDVNKDIINLLEEIRNSSGILSKLKFINIPFSEEIKTLGCFDIILFSSSYHYVYADIQSHDEIFGILAQICKNCVILELPMAKDDSFARAALEKSCPGEILQAYNYHAILNSASKYFGSVRYIANSGFLRTRDIFLLEKPGVTANFTSEFENKKNPWSQVQAY